MRSLARYHSSHSAWIIHFLSLLEDLSIIFWEESLGLIQFVHLFRGKQSASLSMWLAVSQLGLLLRKNGILQYRSIIATILEIALPALFAVILLPVRSIVKSNNIENDTVYEPFGINAFPLDLKLNVLGLFGPVRQMCIGYYPKSSQRATRIISEVAAQLNLTAQGFDLEDEMISYVVDQYETKRCLLAVNFVDDRPESFAYDLRFSYSPRNSREQLKLIKLNRDWKTNLLFTVVPILGPRDKLEEEGGSPGKYWI